MGDLVRWFAVSLCLPEGNIKTLSLVGSWKMSFKIWLFTQIVKLCQTVQKYRSTYKRKELT